MLEFLIGCLVVAGLLSFPMGRVVLGVVSVVAAVVVFSAVVAAGQ